MAFKATRNILTMMEVFISLTVSMLVPDPDIGF